MSQQRKNSGDSPAAGSVNSFEKDPAADSGKKKPRPAKPAVEEIGGPDGPDPTRYGDWERKGRCIDF